MRQAGIRFCSIPHRHGRQPGIDREGFIYHSQDQEHEFKLLFDGEDRSEVPKNYPNKLIITEGKEGARFFDGEKEWLVPGISVPVVDTTGAGDTFNAAFAVQIAGGKSVYEALEFANHAAALSVTKFGAQGGMPTAEEVKRSREG